MSYYQVEVYIVTVPEQARDHGWILRGSANAEREQRGVLAWAVP